MAHAPRFRFYWSKVEGHSILTMPRERWDDLEVRMGEPVRVDIATTPLSGIAGKALVAASVATQGSAATARLAIFRYDQKDDPTPYNQDEYDVWTNLADHPRLAEMVSEASTSDNSNFRAFCRENVFFMKCRPGADHWLPDLPASVWVLLRST